MKIFGHPIHLLLIHFPAALIPMDLACSLLQYYMHNNSFGLAGFYALAGGVAIGWLAICFGLLDLVKISLQALQAQKIALIHGGINTVVIIAYTIFAVKGLKAYPEVVPASMPLIISKAVLVAGMFTGNFFGGNLVLKYGVGTKEFK